jgi:hypothetical protein
MVATFIVKPEGVYAANFFQSPKLLFPIQRIPSFIIRPSGLNLDNGDLFWGSRANTDRRFQFHKRSQSFIRSHNEPLSVAAMCVSNPDCSPLRIND